MTGVLPAREAAWYRLVVPPNEPSWKVALNFDAGDGLLMVQHGALPNLGAASPSFIANITGGKKMQKIGDQHLLCLAGSAGGSLIPGTNYLGVVSEGLNPSNSVSRIGVGSAAFTLYSDGSLPPLDLGWVGPVDLLGQTTLGGGECETWNFSVPAGVPALRVVFDAAETTGNPVLTMTTGDYPPAALGYPCFTNVGVYTLSVPPVRPDNVYFLGVRALSDATFSISSTPGANLIGLDGFIPFAGGSVTTQIPPGGVQRYRIDVPSEALTWSNTAVHASSVRLYLEQGTLPTLTLADHWYSSGANSALTASLVNSSWPWLAG